MWSWEWFTVGNIAELASLEFSIVERSWVVVVKEEGYSGICDVFREAVAV